MRFITKRYILTTIFTICLGSVLLAKSDKDKIEPRLLKSVDKKSMNRWVDSVYNSLTPDERIGQLFMPVVEGGNTTTNIAQIVSLVEKQHVGGILFSKGNPSDQAEITNKVQQKAKTPLLVSLDGEWGLSMRLKNTTQFPRNMMLGAIQNDSLLYYYGKEVARQCRIMGIHINFAPDMDVNSNPQNPVIGNRSFGEDLQRVARLGIMYAKGLEAGGVMAVAKHFPGHGDTSTDSHYTLPVVKSSVERLNEYELVPFRKYINEGLSGMMVGHLNIPALDTKVQPSSLSEPIVTGLLQGMLGFSGLIFTDGLQMKAVSNEENYCVRALAAGNDVLLGPVNTVKEFDAVKKAVANGQITSAQLESKCKKVLAYKYILGLNKYAAINTNKLLEQLNTPYAEWLNRELNKNAITLIKNDQAIVPIAKLDKRKIAAVSIGADANNKFHQTLKQYANVACFNVADSDGLLKLKNSLTNYNTIIISVHSNKGNSDAAIQSVVQGKDAILAFFTVPYRLSVYASSIRQSEAVVVGYENTPLAQEYAAQSLFGGIDINGKMPVSVDGVCNVETGKQIKKVRLEYGVPEDVGISSAKLDNIESIVEEGIRAHAYPGCQVLVAKNGVVIYDKSFGTFTYGGKQAVTNDDIFDLASMTKASATLPAVMKLYDQKQFKLSDPISDYVPLLKGSNKSDITIREALLHETGLPSFIPYYMDAIDQSSYDGKLFNRSRTSLFSAEFDTDTWARIDYKYKSNIISDGPQKGFVPLADKMYISKSYSDTIVTAIANSKLRNSKFYLYSCLNFMLLKEVVEKVSKEDLNSFVQENFFNQLGAVSTTYNPLTKFDKNVIVPTEKDDFLRKQLLQGYVHDEGAAFMGGISGNAGLFSNANDLAKLYQMWLNNGTYGGETYLSKQTCQLFTSTKSSTSRRGLGFDKPDMRTNKSSPCSPSTPASVYGHTGFTGTCFWIDPDNQLIYIFLSNRVNEKRTHKELMSLQIRQRIQEEIYNALKASANQNLM